MMRNLEKAFDIACEQYNEFGVDVNKALETLSKVAISLHCWQGDDVGGFESSDGLSGGGIMATGNYPGRARNAAELRQDIEKVFSLIPGKILVYPTCKGLGLITLDKLGEKLPSVAAKLENGFWNIRAENALLEGSKNG